MSKTVSIGMKSARRNERLRRGDPGIRVLSCILLLILLTCCGEQSPTGPADSGITPAASPFTLVVRDGGRLSLIDRDGSTFVIRFTGKRSWIMPGHIIVGADQGGYLRRVTAVHRETGYVILETEPSSLTEAVISGEIDTVVTLGAESYRSPSGSPRLLEGSEQDPWSAVRLSPGVTLTEGGLNLSGVTLLDVGTGERRSSVTITDGFIAYNPHVETGITVRHRSIERFRANVEGMLRISCNLSVDIPEPIDAADETLLAAFSATSVQYIDSVPVVETVSLTFMAGFEVTGAYVGDCDVTFDAEAYSTIETSFHNGTWTDEGAIEPTFAATPFKCRAFADADIRVFVKPRIDVSFYTEPAVELFVTPDLRVSAETPEAPIWEWAIEGVVRGTVAFHAPILDGGLPPHSASPVDYRATLASGPFATDAYAFVTAWGSTGSGDGQFLFPRGIAVDASRYIYVVDSHAHRVQAFQPDSTFITAWGGRGTGDGEFHFPNRIAVDAAGTVYVLDAENHRVQTFTADGTVLSVWGSEGTGEGQFKDPQGIAVDGGGHVYVTDCFTHRIQRFTHDGTFVSTWGTYGSSEGQLDCPMGIAVDGAGTVYVSECHNHRIQAFTAEGDCLRQWGSYGSDEGRFNCPIDVAVDGDGTVYVVDYGNDRIQVFTPEGRLLTTLGSTGTGNGQFNQPEGIAVDINGQLYIVDSENRRVQRFAPKIRWEW